MCGLWRVMDGWIGRASGFLTLDITGGRKAGKRVSRERERETENADLASKRHVADSRHVILPPSSPPLPTRSMTANDFDPLMKF